MLVYLRLQGKDDPADREEFPELVRGAGLEPVALIRGNRRAPDARTFVGSGKVREIRECLAATEARRVIFNHDLTPVQERNLQRRLGCEVLDRTDLILEIFARRARSYEGRLQVELAQLRRLSTRLVGGWTHLERQKGGIGLRGGPGEAQIETDRRLIARRIQGIASRLERVGGRRRENRRARRHIPVVALVGYTNAGKSRLFNRLTGADTRVAAQPFATLDPTLRRYRPAVGREVILADTVGFIRRLPHELVAAFHATLEEVRTANLLLHVSDIAQPGHYDRLQKVNHTIRRIGAGDVPQIEVFNKLDLVPDAPRYNDNSLRVYLSAATGTGCKALAQAVCAALWGPRRRLQAHLPANAGRLRSLLFEHGVVESERPETGGGWVLRLSIEPSWLERLSRQPVPGANVLRSLRRACYNANPQGDAPNLAEGF